MCIKGNKKANLSSSKMGTLQIGKRLPNKLENVSRTNWKPSLGFLGFAALMVMFLPLAEAAPEFKTYSEASAPSDVNSINVGKPSDTGEGDLLIACYVTDGERTLSAPDANWIHIQGGVHPTDNTPSFRVWYKIAGASEPTNYTFTSSGNEQHYIAILRYQGHHPTSPINASDIAVSTGSSSPTAPSVTTTVDDCTILRAFGADDDDTPYSSPANHNERYNGASGTGWYGPCGGAGADTVQATAGATGTAAFSMNATEEWQAVTIAIAPAPKPTVNITVTPDPTKAQSVGGLELKLVFDQSMNISVEPTVSYDPAGTTGVQVCTGGTWSTTTLTNDTYTVYNDVAITTSTGDGTATISVSGAQSDIGITMDPDTDDTFDIDANAPSNPTIPADGYDNSTDLNSITHNSWQKDYGSLYIEWSGASDPGGGSGIAGYSVCNDADNACEPGFTPVTANENYNLGALSEGVHYVRLRTIDNVGNYSDPAVTMFIYKYDATVPDDLTAPCDSWYSSSKTAGQEISNDTWQNDDDTPYFEWDEPNDATSGIDGYSIYWGTDSGEEPGDTGKEQTGNSYNVGTATGDATYYLRARAYDKAGNYTDPATTLFTFKYDGTAPINPTAPASCWDEQGGNPIADNTPQNSDDTPYFEWSGADDPTSGVSGYSVYWGTDSGGEPITTQEQVDAYYNVSIGTGNATYYLRVRTFDNAGNYSDPITLFTFIFDNAKPTVTIGVVPDPTGHIEAGELQFTLVFSESMDTGTTPTISYDPAGGATGSQPVSTNGSWSTTTYTNDTYTVYNDNAIDSTTGDGLASISVSGALDIAGNAMDVDNDDTFTIDTAMHHFKINHDGQGLINVDEQITITAKTQGGNNVVDYTGTITVSTLGETGQITWSKHTAAGNLTDGGDNDDTATYEFDSDDQGVVVLNMQSSAADTLDIEVTDQTYVDDNTHPNMVVSTYALDYFVIDHDNSGVAGEAESVTVTAINTQDQTKTDYVGTITLDTNGTATTISWSCPDGYGNLSDGGGSSDMATYTFNINDNGVAVFEFTDETAEDDIDIFCYDGSIYDDNSEDAQGYMDIAPAAINYFVIDHDNEAKAGSSDSVTITAYDAYGNVKHDYTGQIIVKTSGQADPDTIAWTKQTGGGDFDPDTPSAGQATYTYSDEDDDGVVELGITDTKAESLTIMVYIGGVRKDDQSEGPMAVGPDVIDYFIVSHDNAAAAGVAENVSITAYDQHDNIKTDYTGEITVNTSGESDPLDITWAEQAGKNDGIFVDSNPDDDEITYTYDALDQGVVYLTITDTSEEDINIVVSDGSGHNDQNLEGNLSVGPPVISYFTVAHDGAGNAGIPETVIITAIDSIGAVMTGYDETIEVNTDGTATTITWASDSSNQGSFNDGGPNTDTAFYTYDPADNGEVTLTITDNSVETLDIDVTGSGKTDTEVGQENLIIGAALLDHFTISHSGQVIAGEDANITIAAIDTLGQTKTDYTGTIDLDTDGTPGTITWDTQDANGTLNEGGGSVDTATYTFVGADSGDIVLTLNDTTAETIKDISVTAGSKTDDDSEADLVVEPAALNKFTVYHDQSGITNVAEYITIKAWDIYDNQKTNYTETITVDTAGGTPANITWALQSGAGTFNEVPPGTCTYHYAASDAGVVVLKVTDSSEESININVSGSGKTDEDLEGNLVFSSTGSTLDMNWLYRRQLTIGSTISDYSVNLVLDGTTTPTASEIYSDCLANGNDLRIGWWTGSDIADIDRHLITFSSSKIDVWFRIQEAGGWGGGLSNYYLYYGNPDAGLPPNDKDNVYLFFDDFNRADSSDPGSKWTVQDNPTMCGISSNRLYLGDDVDYQGQDVVATANGTGGKLATSGILIQVKFMGNGSAQYQNSFVVVDWTNTNNMYTMGARIGANRWRDEQGYSTVRQNGTSETIDNDVWHQMRIYIPNTTNTTQFWGKLSSDPDFEDKGLNRDWGTLNDTVVGLKVQNAHSYFDDFLVRYKTATEPSVTASATAEKMLDNYLGVAANAVTTDVVGVGDTDNLITDIVITNSWGKAITVDSVTLNNVGTASDAEISSVKLYYDSNNSEDYTSGIDSQIGSGTFSSGAKTFSGLSVNIASGGASEYLFAVVDVSTQADDGDILDVAIPIEGIGLSNGADITNVELNSAGQRELDIILDHFSVAHDGSSVAGAVEPITITAKDVHGNTKTDYTDTITVDTTGTEDSITWTVHAGAGNLADGGPASDQADYPFVSADQGVVVLNISDTVAETIDIDVTGSGKTDTEIGQEDLVISPGILNHFSISHDTPPATAGVEETITVTAKDAHENTITDYDKQITLDTDGTESTIAWGLSSGFGTLSLDDPLTDTATYQFSGSSDNGDAIFTITDDTAEPIIITVSDDTKSSESSQIEVLPADIETFVISFTGEATAGVAKDITITAKDYLNNVKTDYTGTITVDTTGTATTISWAQDPSANGTFNDGDETEDTCTYTYDPLDEGVVTLSITDTKAEEIDIQVSDDGKEDDDSHDPLIINPGDIAYFIVSHDGTGVTGIYEDVEITAYDANDNIKTDYTGTIKLDTNGTPTAIAWTLKDGDGSIDDGGDNYDTATYIFHDDDDGFATFGIIDFAAESVDIDVYIGAVQKDQDSEPALEFISSGIDHFQLSHDTNAIVNVAENVIIYAKDANGDTLTTYQGQITISTSQGTPLAITWNNPGGGGTFIPEGAGEGTAQYTYADTDNGAVTLTITDSQEETVNISVSGGGKSEQGDDDLIINPAGLHHFSISHSGSATTDDDTLVTITAKDANDNVVTSHTGQIIVETDGTADAITWGKDTGLGSFQLNTPFQGKATYNYVSGDYGQCILTIQDTEVETINIDVKVGEVKKDDDQEGPLAIGPGAIDDFVVIHDGTAQAGVFDNLTIRARDSYDNLKTDYTGQITVKTDSSSPLTISWDKAPGGGTFNDNEDGSCSYNFIGADNGEVVIKIKDTETESLNIDVYIGVDKKDSSEALLVVWPTNIKHFIVAHDGAGEAGVDEDFTVTVYDTYDNVKYNYTGKIKLYTNAANPATITWAEQPGENDGTFDDTDPQLGEGEAFYTYADSDDGVVYLTISDTKAEGININILGVSDSKTDQNLEGNLVIGPTDIAHFTVVHSGITEAGVEENVTITAYDTYSNVKDNYTSKIKLYTNAANPATITWAEQPGENDGTFDDTDPQLGEGEAFYTYADSDDGVVYLTISDNKAEGIYINALGSVDGKSGSSAELVVDPAGIDHFHIFHDGSGVVDIPESITIYARDEFKNVKTDDYTGTINLDTTVGSPTITWDLSQGGGDLYDGGPSTDTASYTYVSADDGVVVLTLTDSVAEEFNISITGDATDDGEDSNLIINPVGGTNTGLVSPAANSGAFTNPTNAYADDTSRATSSNNQTHQYYTYGFDSMIPSGSIILGIEVRLDAFADGTTGIYQYGVELSWDGGSSFTGSGNLTPDMSTSEVTYTLGGPTDGWGRTWTLSELSDANFRVRVNSTTRGSNYDASLDWIPVRVYYEPPPDAAANAVITDSVAAGQSDVLILDVTLTSNGTQNRTINSVKVDNVGTASDTEISAVKLYYDSNNSGDYTSGTDIQVGSGVFTSGSKTFSGLNIIVPGSGTENLYVILDVASNITDGDTLDAQIPINGISFSDGAQIEDVILNSSGARTVSLTLDHFVISHDGSAEAGQPESVVVTAKDANGNTKTSYTGTITLNTDTQETTDYITWASLGSGDLNDSPTDDTAAYTFDAADSGTVTFTITDEKAETIVISVLVGVTEMGSAPNLVVSPGVLDHFSLSHDTAATAGVADSVIVSARDVHNNIIEDYQGTITLATDTSETTDYISWELATGFGDLTDSPTDDTATYTFDANDDSQATFEITDTKAEDLDISVTDGEKNDDYDGPPLTVSAADLHHFDISHDQSAQAGVADDVTITANDQYGNTVLNYASQITVDTDSGLPSGIEWAEKAGENSGIFSEGEPGTATYTYVVADSGEVVLTITAQAIEDLTISASVGVITSNAAATLNVGPGLIEYFTITHDGLAQAEQAENITIKAYDAYDNLKTDYQGTITLDVEVDASGDITWAKVGDQTGFSDGGLGDNTATYTFQSGDSGSADFTITDDIAETINIKVTADTKQDDDNEGVLEVVAAGFHHFKVTHDGNAVVGVAENITIAAKDVNDDTVTSYEGIITIDTSGTATAISWAAPGANGILDDGGETSDTATYDFDPADQGEVTLTFTDTTAETIDDFMVTGSGVNDDNTEPNLVVHPIGLHHFAVAHDGTATAGTPESFTVTAEDANDSTVVDYTGAITLSTAGGTQETITWDKVDASGALVDNVYTFVSDDNGLVTLSISDTKAETLNINVSDDGKTDDTSDVDLVISPADLYKFIITHDGDAEAGIAEDITITAQDVYENILVDYTGEIIVTTNATPTTAITWDKTIGNGNVDNQGDGTATYTYVDNDDGVVVLNITDTTSEDLDIDVYIGAQQWDKDNEPNLVVGAGALMEFRITYADGQTLAGTGEQVTITAYDVYDNVKTNYTDTITLTTSTQETTDCITWTKYSGYGELVDSPTDDTATYDYLDIDDGVVTLIITDTKAESLNIDVSGSGKFDDDEEGPLDVLPAGLYDFQITHDEQAIAGTPEDITIYAKDFYDNTQTDYTDTITLSTDTPETSDYITWGVTTGTNSISDSPTDDTATYTYDTNDSGKVILNITDIKTEAIDINAADGAYTDDNSHNNLVVEAADLQHLTIEHDGQAIQSIGEEITVTAYDIYDNVKANYTGSITLDTDSLNKDNISWPSSSGSGPFADWGDGTAEYTYVLQDEGTASFMLTDDNPGETIKISATDDPVSDESGNLEVIASEISVSGVANALSDYYIAQDANDILVLEVTLTNNNVLDSDTVLTVLVNNTGTILYDDISAVKLYYDSNSTGEYEWDADSQVGTGAFSAANEYSFTGLDINIPAGQTKKLFVTVDLDGTVSDADTVDVSIPPTSITFANASPAEDIELNSDGILTVDSADPGNVSNLTTTSHNNAIIGWNDPQSRDNTVYVSWTQANDSGSGIDGYSVEWNAVPDTTKDIEETVSAVTSSALPDGAANYFYIRSVDKVGNWSDPPEYWGPVYIDTTGPASTDIIDIEEYAGQDYLHYIEGGNTIYYSGLGYSVFKVCVAGVDIGSGLKEAQFPATTSSGGTDTTEETGEYQYVHTYTVSSSGSSYNNVNVVVYDLAGNSTNVPFNVILDNTPPSTVASLDSSHTVGESSAENTITFDWTNVSDDSSGLAGYSFIVNTSPSTDAPKYMNVNAQTAAYQESGLSNYDYYAHIRPVDNVGNWGSTFHVGPYKIGRGALTASLAASQDVVSTDQQFTVTMTVQNSGGGNVYDVDPSSLIVGSTGGASANTSSNPAVQNIAPTEAKQFQWTYTAGSSSGTLNFQGFAQGSDDEQPEEGEDVTSNTAKSADVVVEQKASLNLTVSASPSTVNTNETINITVTISNNGQADALNVTPSLSTTGSTATVGIDSGPSPSSATIKGGRTQNFTYTANATSIGSAKFTGNISAGTDENSGDNLTVGGDDDSVTVQTPSFEYELTSSITAEPEAVEENDTITVTMTVQNTGNSPVTNILPSPLNLIVGGTSSDADKQSGPTSGDSVNLQDSGDSYDFIWTFSAGDEEGTVNFAGFADGQEANSSQTTSNDVIIQAASAALSSSISVSPGSLLTNATITVTMTVNNTAPVGGATANNVAPSILTLGGTSGQANLLTGPNPTSADIAAGGSEDFVWTYQASINEGTVNFTGNATGTDANSGNEVSSNPTTSINSADISTLSAEWSYPSGANTVGPVRGVPVVGDDGNIYFGSDDNNLYIINGTSHALEYYCTTSGDVRGMPWPDTESGDKYVVYFGTLGRTVHKYCPVDSELSWERDIGTNLTTTALYDYEGVNAGLYFAAEDRKVYRLYGSNGELDVNWIATQPVLGDDIQSDLSIAPATPVESYNEIFLGANDGLLYVFSTFDGTPLRDFDPEDYALERGAIKTAPFIAPKDITTHTIFFGTENGLFYALNTSDLSLDSDWATNPIDVDAAIYSSPWVDVATRYAYFGCEDGKLYAFSMDDGTPKLPKGYLIDVGAAIQSWPLVANGIVYFGADDNKFYAVDVETGEIVPGWPYDMGGPVKGGISLQFIDEDNIYILVGSDAGKIYSFELIQ